MNQSRRRLLAGIGTAGLASVAGCTALEFALGRESLEFAASPAVVTDGAVSESGYRESRQEADMVVQEFEVAGQSRAVEVTNQLAEYDRGITVLTQRFRGALFTVLSTPKVEVLGQSFNPVGDMSTDELAAMIQDRYDEIDSVSRESSRTVGVLGEDVEIVRYRAAGRFIEGNLRVDLTLHVSEAVAVGDDFVICLAIHPRIIDDTDAVNTLLSGVTHRE